jgi:hypothetical protein
MEQAMKLTSKTAGIGIMTMAALMLGTAVIADSMGAGEMGGAGMMMGGAEMDFAAMDGDKDGKVSKDEVAAFRAARVTAADANGDGKLSVEEISAMQLKAMQQAAGTMAQRMIDRLDSDGDKMLSVAEMMERPMPEAMFDRMDTNEDGFIDQAEADAAKAQMMERGKGRGQHGKGGHDGHKGDHDGQMGQDGSDDN